MDRKRKILIVAPPYRLSQTAFPLGLMWIAAVLQKAGHEVGVIDMDAYNLTRENLAKELREREYDYFLTGGMITAWNFLRFVCDYVKSIKPDAKVVVGGGVISSTPRHFISTGSADAGVIGEGEATILDLVDAFENNRDLASVAGIVFRRAGEVVRTMSRKGIEDLDSIPFPAWDLFNVKEIYSRFPSHSSIFSAKRTGSVYTTRGCPFQCSFCYTEKTVRQRSVPNIIEEFKELKGKFGIGHIMIADDLFVVNKNRTVEFCEAMIRNRLNMTWAATGRCNIVEQEFLKLMKAAGCVFLGLGIESGSKAVLKSIKKNQTPEQIIEAVKMVQKAGIVPGGTFIIGLPAETRETIRETVDIYKQINRYRTHVNKFFFATPYPGTSLYEELYGKGRIGDEIKYFELISERGDAVDFVINCTESFTDAELIRLKKDVEDEVFRDFLGKHPWRAFVQWVSANTPWAKIRNAIIAFKMKGVVDGVRFLWIKLLVKLKKIPDPYERRWAKKVNYSYVQTMVEGKTVTF